jgi:beta-lactamase class A
LKAQAEQKIRPFAGTVALYAKNLDTGEDFGLRPDARVRTASTIKLPILVAAFAAVEQGKATWQDTIEMRAEIR